MNTRGNSHVYSHRLSHYTFADRTIDLGSIQYFNDVCSTEERAKKLCYINGPVMNCDNSLFFNNLV